MDEAVTLPPAGMNAGAHVEQSEHSRVEGGRSAKAGAKGPGFPLWPCANPHSLLSLFLK